MKEDNPLVYLLYRYKDGDITDEEKTELYKLVDKFLLFIVNAHYKHLQRLRLDTHRERQRIRIDLFFDFIRGNWDMTPQCILYSFRRRFVWIEMLVDCKLYGIQLFDYGTHINKQINSAILGHIILGNQLYRGFIATKGREPETEELVIEYIKHILRSGKRVRFSYVERLLGNYLKWLHCKRYADPIQGFDEEYNVSLRKSMGRF